MIYNAIILALIVFFIHVCTWDGHIFHKPAEWLREKLGEEITKPMFACPICMTPYYGTILYLLFDYMDFIRFEDSNWFTVLVTVLIASGMNCFSAIAAGLYQTSNAIEEYIETELQDNIVPEDKEEIEVAINYHTKELNKLKQQLYETNNS